MEPSSGFVKVKGHNIYYNSFGAPVAGTVLALSGGPFGTHDVLIPLADLVQFGYRVVMYDYLGCGKSDRPKGATHYTEDRAHYIAVLRDFLDGVSTSPRRMS